MEKAIPYLIPFILLLWGGISFLIVKKKINLPAIPSRKGQRLLRRAAASTLKKQTS